MNYVIFKNYAAIGDVHSYVKMACVCVCLRSYKQAHLVQSLSFLSYGTVTTIEVLHYLAVWENCSQLC